jgi:hypothetical protein
MKLAVILVIVLGVTFGQSRVQTDAALNRQLDLWMSVKAGLSGAGGVEYFNLGMKDALIPGGANGVDWFRGTVISQNSPSVLVIGIEKPDQPEVTLELVTPSGQEARLQRTIPKGTVVEFGGRATKFSPSPFMVTFEVELKQLIINKAPAAK